MGRLLMLGISLILTSTVTQAGGSRDVPDVACGDNKILVGMTLDEVMAGCTPNWKPAYISEHIRSRRDGSSDTYHKWLIYPVDQPGTHVLFKNGEIVRIFTNIAAPAPAPVALQ
ncbi:hypothetical protein Q7C_2541 [Methylophaga frappieri]|uniref:DUF2845 domain-containing protein n=1 Tax=Methylophaga frappieri (strain ATCC BAA-2434 / DSM 25690 / JAM7) TaxID=754477 RepID=I1YL69_METFJ|nr:hypothetical protein [Methylophaga frappieri]AFJ03662.1 hypothetical protein Q7C_2541 [Methylophaga frappieri]